AWLMREFVIGQNLGHWRRWLKALAKFPFAILASALLSQTTKYMQARVGILWRRTATRRLLRSYFSDMNYYKLSQHGSARIEDPDIRICSDVRSGCEALTGVLISGLSGVTMSLFSSWALYRRRGLFAVSLPYLYSFFIVPLSYRRRGSTTPS
ncbi:ABCD1, partial [Symbiodinium sp. CCMP2592]